MGGASQGAVKGISPDEFSKQLKLPFKDMLLLSRALTHRSYLNEHPEAIEDNERLEFLGDAVLDFLVGAWLYQHFPEMKEGDLTRLRSALVRTEQLADFAKKINLGLALRLGRGEGKGGGRQRDALLCGAFEALVGALYLDSGLSAVKNFVEPMLISVTETILLSRADQDPKSQLQELAQARGLGTPYYRTVSASGPEHDKLFEVEVLINSKVYGHGVGHNKQAATKVAARAALEQLESE